MRSPIGRAAASLAIAAALLVPIAVTTAPATARVSDDEAPAAVLARVLTRARETGAIERVLGTHCFSFIRTFLDDDGSELGRMNLVMRYRIGLVPGAETLRVAVTVGPARDPSGVQITYEVGLDDGRIRFLESDFGHEPVRVVARGEELVGNRSDDDRVPYAPDVSPKVVLAFVLPMLHDQGLPDRVAFRDLTPFGDVAHPIVLSRLESERPDEVVYGTLEGWHDPSTTLRIDAKTGLLRAFVTNAETTRDPKTGKDTVTHVATSTRIPDAEYARLLAEARRAEGDGEGDGGD